MSVKNLGPEDTLLYQIDGLPAAIYIWGSVPAGDSVIINVLNFINDGTGTTDGIYAFCFYLKYDLYHTIEDLNPENDTTCISFIVKGSRTGIADPKQKGITSFINLYPQPCKRYNSPAIQ